MLHTLRQVQSSVDRVVALELHAVLSFVTREKCALQRPSRPVLGAQWAQTYRPRTPSIASKVSL